MRVTFVVPDVCPKPRQTRADVWKKRPSVVKYRQFADLVRLIGRSNLRDIRPDHVEIDVTIEIPKSCSKKERERRMGQPHRQKPDIDNLLKAVCDALWEDDSCIWTVSASKRWGAASQTVITVIQID